MIDLQQGEQIAAMYVSFASETLDNNQITDYLTRDPAQTGDRARRAARRDPGRRHLRHARVAEAGADDRALKGHRQRRDHRAAIQQRAGGGGFDQGPDGRDRYDRAHRPAQPDEFRKLVVREQDGAIVRLGDIADVCWPESYGTSVRQRRRRHVHGHQRRPGRELAGRDQGGAQGLGRPDRPAAAAGHQATIPYDSTEAIQDAINEVISTIVEALVIVIVVIFLFSARCAAC